MSADREMDHLEMQSDMHDSHHNQPYCYGPVKRDPLDAALAAAFAQSQGIEDVTLMSAARSLLSLTTVGEIRGTR